MPQGLGVADRGFLEDVSFAFFEEIGLTAIGLGQSGKTLRCFNIGNRFRHQLGFFGLSTQELGFVTITGTIRPRKKPRLREIDLSAGLSRRKTHATSITCICFIKLS